MLHTMKHPIVITSRGEVTRRNKFDYNSILSGYLASKAGQQKLAQSMIAPLRRRLDYQGIARKVFAVQPLPQGAAPVYDRDLVSDIIAKKYKFDAIKISRDGEIYKKSQGRKFRGVKVTFPMFNIISNPTIKLGDIKRRRFNIIDRSTIRKAKAEIMSQEDSMIFEALDKLV